MPGAAGQLKALWQQLIGGTAPAGAASVSGDVSQMVKYIAAGTASAAQLPLRLRLPMLKDLAQGTSGLGLSGGPPVWQAANTAVYIPFELDQAATLIQMHVVIAASAGNIDVGVYDSAGTLKVTMGTTAMGAVGVQTFNVADTPLAKGRYFAAVACSNGATATLATYVQESVGAAVAAGYKKQITAFPLPASATYASPTASGIPLVMLEFS